MSGHNEATATMPFTLDFRFLARAVPQAQLQSYSWIVTSRTTAYLLGGRQSGLHKFHPGGGGNFPDPNTHLWKLDLATGTTRQLLDLTLLRPDLAAPLTATNQQCYHDRATGEWLVVGGYGIVQATASMLTFDTLIRIPVAQFVEVVESADPDPVKVAKLEAMMIVQHDPAFAVTGGALRKLGHRYLLVGGQLYDGSYDPFLGNVDQEYTGAVRYFQIDPQTDAAVSIGALTSPDLDQPLHRRDGPIIDTIDPATGAPRVTAFGGVSPPGQLDGYYNPVNVDLRNGQLLVTTDRRTTQLFNQYECPTVVVWHGTQSLVYHTFFGGISRTFYHQTPPQKAMYDTVTQQGRNDGLPFVCDISTLRTPKGGATEEFLAPEPIPTYALRGASTELMPPAPGSHPAVAPSGVVDLDLVKPGEQVLVGYIFGGIEAEMPLPKYPNFGSAATDAFYQVLLTRVPSKPFLPASVGRRAVGVLQPPTVTA